MQYLVRFSLYELLKFCTFALNQTPRWAVMWVLCFFWLGTMKALFRRRCFKCNLKARSGIRHEQIEVGWMSCPSLCWQTRKRWTMCVFETWLGFIQELDAVALSSSHEWWISQSQGLWECVLETNVNQTTPHPPLECVCCIVTRGWVVSCNSIHPVTSNNRAAPAEVSCSNLQLHSVLMSL